MDLDILKICDASTAMTVPVFVAACTTYESGREVDGDKIRNLVVHCKH